MSKTAAVLHYTLMYEGQSLLTLTCLRYVVLMLALTIFCVMNKNIKHCFENKFQLVENSSSGGKSTRQQSGMFGLKCCLS